MPIILLTLLRHTFTDESTISSLYHKDKFLCYFLEDARRPVKIAGKTCIPKGTYRIQVTYSPRFKRMMPLLFDVPDFVGIRVHTGNTAKDTDGCPLPGMKAGKDIVLESAVALKYLNEYVDSIRKNNQEVWVQILEAM